MGSFMLIMVIVVLSAILCVVALYNEKKKELDEKRAKIQKLRRQKLYIEAEKEKLEKRCEYLEEIIFFSQLGASPSDEDKKKMVAQLSDDINFIVNIRSKYREYPIDAKLSNYLNSTEKELYRLFSELSDSLTALIRDNRSIYPRLSDYFSHYGFSFCGRILTVEPEDI